MESNFDQKDVESITRVLKARMANAAFLQMEHINGRSVTALQLAGVISGGTQAISADVIEVVKDVAHPRRVAGSPGPFIFYRDVSKATQQYALDMTGILFNEEVNSRLSAVSHFEHISIGDSPKLSPGTCKVLKERRLDIASTIPKTWQSAALSLYDAITTDLLCQLAAVKQSLEQHFDDGLREYFPKVLRPSLLSLESLELKVITPTDQIKDIETIIEDCAARESLPAACDEYLRLLGFVPLCVAHSLARTIRRWQERHEYVKDLWQVLWAWADQTQSPVARYHVCKVFLDEPGLLPSGKEQAAWLELLEMLPSPIDEVDTLRWRLQWTVRKELAQHYLYFLESRAPGANGEPLAVFAWWLAERIAGLIGPSVETINSIRNIAIVPDAQSSKYAWRLSNPRTTPSALARTTHFGESTWALSILNGIADASLCALKPGLDDRIASRFEHGLAATIMYGFPFYAMQSNDAVYAFDTTLADNINAWRSHRAGINDELGTAIAIMYEKLSKPAEFVSAIQKISDESETEQLIIAHWAKALALQDALPKEEVWKCLTDTAWRKTTFSRISDVALDQLFVAFSLALDRSDKKWMAGLSHIYASAYEEADDRKGRRQLLFVFTAISGIHTYSVSALQRLLTGTQRQSYIVFLGSLRNALLSHSGTPPWLTARIRAVLAAAK